MSASVGQGVYYVDPGKSARSALVTAYDEPTKTADLVLVSDDPQKRRLLTTGDYTHGLERRFTVECVTARFARLQQEKQKRADETGIEQPAITVEDLHDTFSFSPGGGVTLDPKAVFVPKPKPVAVEATPAAPAAPATPAAASTPAPPIHTDPDFAGKTDKPVEKAAPEQTASSSAEGQDVKGNASEGDGAENKSETAETAKATS